MHSADGPRGVELPTAFVIGAGELIVTEVLQEIATDLYHSVQHAGYQM